MAKSRKRNDASSVIDPQEQPGQPAEQLGADASGRESYEAGDHRDRVALRAYELYLARGRSDGRDFDDWLAAERELVRAGGDSGATNGQNGPGDIGE